MSDLSPLTCQEAFDRLGDFADRELVPEDRERVEAHLALCARCAREFAFETSVLDALRRTLRRITVPEGLASRIAARLAEAEPGDPARDPDPD